jgi:hypothetical protein
VLIRQPAATDHCGMARASRFVVEYSIIFNDMALCSIGHIHWLESQRQRENRAIST